MILIVIILYTAAFCIFLLDADKRMSASVGALLLGLSVCPMCIGVISDNSICLIEGMLFTTVGTLIFLLK